MRPTYYVAQITQLEKLVCDIVSTLCSAFKKWVKQKADKTRQGGRSFETDLTSYCPLPLKDALLLIYLTYMQYSCSFTLEHQVECT